ncbi:MAG: hypothetical protein Fur0021_00460 [Candidatus Promineifilaceae bacterium]
MKINSSIDRLVIRSFKSIVAQEISLGQVNVLIGANGSGKSNILEAFGVLSAAASGRVDDESLQRRGVRPGVPRLYKNAFPIRIPPEIYFEAHASNASYTVSLLNPLESPKPAWEYKSENLQGDNQQVVSRGIRTRGVNGEQGLAALKLVELDESHPASQLIALLRDYAIYTPNTLMLRGLAPDPQTRQPVGLSGGRLAEAMKELQSLSAGDEVLADALDDVTDMIDWIRDFDTTDTPGNILSATIPRTRLVLRFRDRYMRETSNTLTAYDASEGSLYILFCAALALSPKTPKCIAIDNLDQVLNPRLARKLVRSLCQWVTTNPEPRQLLFTAHNPAVLDGLPLQDDRVRLFAVDRNSEGHTQVQRVVISDELRQLSEEKGWPLSRLWVMGHLGGVPNV